MTKVAAAVGNALNGVRGAAEDLVVAVAKAAKAAAVAEASAGVALADARNAFEAAAESCMSSLNALTLAAWPNIGEGDAELANIAHATVEHAKAALNKNDADAPAAAAAVAEAAQTVIAALARVAASGGAAAAIETLSRRSSLGG